MYKLDLPVDYKEAAAIERRRRMEEERKSRIFNAKCRTIGVRFSPTYTLSYQNSYARSHILPLQRQMFCHFKFVMLRISYTVCSYDIYVVGDKLNFKCVSTQSFIVIIVTSFIHNICFLTSIILIITLMFHDTVVIYVINSFK